MDKYSVCVIGPGLKKKPMWPMRLLERGGLNCFEEFSSVNWPSNVIAEPHRLVPRCEDKI